MDVEKFRSRENSSTTKQSLTRRRGACDSCKARKVRCDGTRPCNQCYRLERQCIYKAARKARQNSQSHGSSLQLSPLEQVFQPQHLSSSTEQSSEGESTHRDSLLPRSPFSFSPEDILPDELWNTSGNEDLSLLPMYNFEAGSGIDCVLNGNGLRSRDASIISTQSIFNGTPKCSDDSFFSNRFFDQNVDCQVSTVYSDIQEDTRSEGRVRTSNLNEEVISRGVSERRQSSVNAAIPVAHKTGSSVLSDGSSSTANEPTAYYSIRSVFSLALLGENNDLRTECLSLFDELQPRQYEFVRATDIAFSEPTSPPYTRAILEEFVDACYEDPVGLGLFLSSDRLKVMVSLVLEARSSSITERALVYSAIAIGCHWRNMETGKAEDSSDMFFQRPLQSLSDILLSKDHLIKLQSLVTMMIYAKRLGLRCFHTLMTNAVSCAQSLHLYRKTGITSLTPDPEQQIWAARTFWYLYSLAQPYCVRWGLALVIDEDIIDLVDPKNLRSINSSNSTSFDHLQLQVRYARLCSQIRKSYYQNMLLKPLGTLETLVEELHRQLEEWKSEAPIHSWSTEPLVPKELCHRRVYFEVHLQYYEAKLALDSPCIRTGSSSLKVMDQQRNQAFKRCLQTAKMILEYSDRVQMTDFGINRALILPLLVAVRIIFLTIVLDWSEGDEVSYLAMACGIFGRLSMGTKLPLREVVELNWIIQRLASRQGASDKSSLL